MSILNGDLSPGEHIRELELSRFFKTSYGPVREALRFIEIETIRFYWPILRILEISCLWNFRDACRIIYRQPHHP